MKAKHYVSFEAARLLKEKGYNEECEYAYNEINMQIERIGANANYISDYCSAPTLLEAIDWLEERGVFISVEYFKDMWHYYVYSRKYLDDNYETDELFYTDRYKCMNAAIKKGVELLSIDSYKMRSEYPETEEDAMNYGKTRID